MEVVYRSAQRLRPPGAVLLPADQLADREAELAAAKARFRKPRRRAQN